MDYTTSTVVLTLLGAIAGFGGAWLWNRTRPTQDEKRVAELEVRLDERARQVDELRAALGVKEAALVAAQSAHVELSARLAQAQTRLEEEREQVRQGHEAQRAVEDRFKSLSADALRANNQSFLDLAKAALAEF